MIRNHCLRMTQVGKGKEGCGRVVVRKQLGVVNAYTMEASFMGADQVTSGGVGVGGEARKRVSAESLDCFFLEFTALALIGADLI